MKQKLLKALSLAAIALCSVSTAWADRVAPTVPKSKAPVDGGCYWLYNVAADLYIGTNSSSLAKTGGDVFLTKSGDYWNILHNGYVLACRNNETYAYFYIKSNLFDKNDADWIISTTGSYISLCPKKKESESPAVYLGYPTTNNPNNYPYLTQAENIDWQLHDSFEAEHYTAEKALYDALTITDGRGWIRDKYETLYDNRTTASASELNEAASELNRAFSSGFTSFSSQNDYAIMLVPDKKWNLGTSFAWHYPQASQTATITATVETTEDADLRYHLSNNYCIVHVYIDGEKRREIAPGRGTWFDTLKKGKHIIEWVYECIPHAGGVSQDFSGVGVENTPLITVNCPLPGSLGTEILYNVDGLKDVRNLKVIGDLNADDMTRLTMLTGVHYIDLSEATCTADVPNYAFENHSWLHSLILPEGIKKIGIRTFNGSPLNHISLPSTLETIGSSAFANTNVESIEIPEKVTSLSESLFSGCENLKAVTMHEGIKTIAGSTFQGCISYIPVLPQNLESIGQLAFADCDAIKTIVIPDNVRSIGTQAFSCKNLEEITLPTKIYQLTSGRSQDNDWGILANCSSLKKLTLNSPTMVSKTSLQAITRNEYRPNITLCVPDYLVNQYKLDPYWYNFGDIVGFSTDLIKDWTINADLLLDSHSRIAGDPNLTIENGALRIEGDAAMGITNFQTTAAFNNYNHNNSFSSLSQVRSGCENITIKGDYTHWMKFYGSRWAFVSLPFDCKVSDITDLTEGRLHAVRYYDGAERAATGTGSSWKKFAADAIIPAGQGFIIQVDGDGYNKGEYGWVQFKSQDNASKQYVFSKKEFSKHLDKNSSTVESNQGWNLVGNPYQCYYNIHKLNFTAPITVWDGSNRTYAAYSIIDDDYALRPNEAFFVQCPSALDAITFPVGGKQFDNVILTQNASQHRAAATSSRKMLNLTLSNDEATDQTRIVINDEANLGYETTCDASKFMSMDNTVAQLYTLDSEGTQYAINERPYDDGFVQLGTSFAADGNYTIALARNDMGSAFLTDCETGETTDLTLGEYTFHANAGIDNSRFVLSFVGEGNLTAIEALTGNSAAEYYTIDGRHMGNNRNALGKGVYVVRSGNRSAKILVD